MLPLILIFSHVSEQCNSIDDFQRLAEALQDANITFFILTTYRPNQDLEADNGEYLKAWNDFHQRTTISFVPNITNALESAKLIGRTKSDLHTLITGSQHLVGSAPFHLARPIPK
jgi:folylpolyglutamate synthase